MVPVPLLGLSLVVMDFLFDVASASSPSESGRFEPSLTTVVGNREMVGNFWVEKSEEERESSAAVKAELMQAEDAEMERRA
jgi:hypothetical protein